ncbi:unnamed protein product [Phytomonas sp. EM1]|nr:unnamed protein product [Phytomonas sp. EM1]|eukprot:CCW65289.1 unnamed protein product [Phytomonas sp. isolate EM1]
MLTDDALDTHFTFEDALPQEPPRKEKRLEICQDYQKGRCRLGDSCPQRHILSDYRTVQTRVCKHWLRGACVNGENCLYLHEYENRFVPLCAFYERLGECTNPECPFVHAQPQEKLPECAAYRRGFCPLGPACKLRHVERRACAFYLAGFCPLGPRCPLGHPIQELHDRVSVFNRILDRMIVQRADDPSFNRTATCYRPGCFDPGHLAPNCPGPQHSVLHRHLNQLQEPGQRVSAMEGEVRGGPRRCYLCGQEGHQVKDCPMNTRTHRGRKFRGARR